MKSLDKVAMYQDVWIRSLQNDAQMKRRLLDLGFSQGSKITPVLDSPSKGMRTFLVKGCKIALRLKDAALMMTYEEGEFEVV